MRLSCSRSTILASALFASSLLACGDDGGAEVGDEAETSTTGDGTTAGDSDESGDSGSSDGNDADTTDAETSDAETTDADTSDSVDTSAETTDADTSETKGSEEETTDTGNLECAAIGNIDECDATAGCQAVVGQPLEGGGLGSQPCLGMSEFLGCIPEQICDDALTWFCMGEDRYLVPNGCGPEGFDMCQGPPNIPMDCK